MKNLTNLLKTNWLVILTFPIKSFLVSILSYYFFKTLIINTSDIVLIENERYYLGLYAFIQMLTILIFFKGIGLFLEEYINSWIKRNEHQLMITMDNNERKEANNFVLVCMSILITLKIISIDELDQLDEIKVDDESHERKWRSTIDNLKNLFGLAVLALLTYVVTWKADALFIVSGIILTIIFVGSITILSLYYFVIKNLHVINTFIGCINTSSRFLKKNISLDSKSKQRPIS